MAKGVSLHIGLNRIDPNAYNGDDGQLAGCENDARDMEAISNGEGFATTMLLNEEATSNRVIEEIGRAAQDLAAGDTFVLTYSGHGGQIPDSNGDEDDQNDETWCLFDRMLVDDELNSLWSQFAPGARIFMLSDSCHSGTVARQLLYKQLAIAPVARTRFRARSQSDIRWRMLSPVTQHEAYERLRPTYEALQWVSGRRRASIGATVILISGCQDNQLSADGDGNGLFTATLKDIWQNGGFQGSHYRFHQDIAQKMPPEQSPHYSVVGVSNSAFEEERPWTIGGTVSNGVQVPTSPTVIGAAEWSRDGSPPSFDVDTGGAPYYVFEIARDAATLDDPNRVTGPDFYASWDDPASPARLTESPFVLPQSAWDQLKSADMLSFRVGTTTSANSWDGWTTSYTNSMMIFGDAAVESSGVFVSSDAEWPRDGAAPVFSVTLDAQHPYYVFEIAKDDATLNDPDRSNGADFYGSWGDSDARLTDSSFQLPDAAWEDLKTHDELVYLVYAASAPEGWDDYVESARGRLQITGPRQAPARKRGKRARDARDETAREREVVTVGGWSLTRPPTANGN
jgi:hypothetical protein